MARRVAHRALSKRPAKTVEYSKPVEADSTCRLALQVVRARSRQASRRQMEDIS